MINFCTDVFWADVTMSETKAVKNFEGLYHLAQQCTCKCLSLVEGLKLTCPRIYRFAGVNHKYLRAIVSDCQAEKIGESVVVIDVSID